MSETVHYIGKIPEIESVKGLPFKEAIDILSQSYDIEDLDYDSEYFYCYNVINLEDIFYHIEKYELDAYTDILNATPIDNGYNFELKFYNGGCSFQEALETAICRLNKT